MFFLKKKKRNKNGRDLVANFNWHIVFHLQSVLVTILQLKWINIYSTYLTPRGRFLLPYCFKVGKGDRKKGYETYRASCHSVEGFFLWIVKSTVSPLDWIHFPWPLHIFLLTFLCEGAKKYVCSILNKQWWLQTEVLSTKCWPSCKRVIGQSKLTI